MSAIAACDEIAIETTRGMARRITHPHADRDMGSDAQLSQGIRTSEAKLHSSYEVCSRVYPGRQFGIDLDQWGGGAPAWADRPLRVKSKPPRRPPAKRSAVAIVMLTSTQSGALGGHQNAPPRHSNRCRWYFLLFLRTGTGTNLQASQRTRSRRRRRLLDHRPWPHRQAHRPLCLLASRYLPDAQRG